MSQRDFILRLIEQFGVTWARIVRQLDANLFPSANKAVGVAYQQYLGLDADQGQSLSARDLLARVRFGAASDVAQERSAILATLLNAQAMIVAGENLPDQAAMFRQKALDVVLAVRLYDQPGLPEWLPRVPDLVAALAAYTLPATTLRMLVGYHEQHQDYAAAEDRLFDLLHQAPDAARVLGDAFYARLEAQSDEQLQAGHFSCPEIAAGRKALHA